MLCFFRRHGQKPSSVPDAVWDSWTSEWAKEGFRDRCQQYSQNRRSETCGAGSGPSRHTGGSRSMMDHTRDLVITYPYDFVKFQFLL